MEERRPDDVPRRSRTPALLALTALVAVVGVAIAGAAGHLRAISAPPPAADAAAAQVPPAPAGAPTFAPAPPAEKFSIATLRLARNQTVGQALMRLDVAGDEVKGILGALKDKFHFRKARPGDQLQVERREGDGTLERFSYRQGAADEWIVERLPDGTLQGHKRDVAITTDVARVAVTIDSSLYDALQKADEDPNLAVLAADVLAWDVDFYQDVRKGDRMRILVEKQFADGRFLKYGDVLAAEYDGAVTGKKQLFRYTDPHGQTTYFDADGNSARRGFLRSPVKFVRITSGFGNRRHPLLGYMKAHEGVDYGAPIGTPIWAVGDGRVEQAGWNGGCGKSVTLRHRNGLETLYCHMSKVAVSAGEQVSQKEIIGYVGSTGLSTGPHCHYAVKRNGHFVNPLTLKIPRDAPVPAEWRADYLAKIAPLRAQLDAEPVAIN